MARRLLALDVARVLKAEMERGRAAGQASGKPTEGALAAVRIATALDLADEVASLFPETCPITGLPEHMFR